MSLRIVLRNEAQAEFDEAFDWLETQRAGLGVALTVEVERVFARVADNPLLYGVVLADIRKAVLRRFNYILFYRVHADRIEVIAFFHGSEDPAIWQGRI